jgi:hypothetical protein
LVVLVVELDVLEEEDEEDGLVVDVELLEVGTVEGMVTGMDVVVEGAVAVGFSIRKSWTAVRAAAGGWAMVDPFGTKAIVIS